MRLQYPITDLPNRRVNRTLHGRSVYRPQDVPGHNVFKGYTVPGTGDGVDLFGAAGTDVLALGDCQQVRHSNDASRLEVIYLQGDGWLGVYAHINATRTGTGSSYQAGAVVGKLRSDLGDPHLHFELWIGGTAVSAPTPAEYLKHLCDACQPATETPDEVWVRGKPVPGVIKRGGVNWVPAKVVCEIVGARIQFDAGAVHVATDEAHLTQWYRLDTIIGPQAAGYVRIADLAPVLGLRVSYNDKARRVVVG